MLKWSLLVIGFIVLAAPSSVHATTSAETKPGSQLLVEESPPEERRFFLEVETGAYWQSRNEIHIPDSAAGTRFSLTDLQGRGPRPQSRVEALWYPAHRHAIRFVYQPIRFSGTGSFAQPVGFAGGTFASGVPVDSQYKFDNYRLTYRYLFLESPEWRISLGGTLFLRDAKVELRQGPTLARDSDVGVVPLLSFNAEYAFAPRWAAVLDFDGLVAPQGRAIDAAFKVRHDLTDRWSVSVGYRSFEGGVDNSDRFAFGWFHFAFVSLGFRL
jgi:hypothetical protein